MTGQEMAGAGGPPEPRWDEQSGQTKSTGWNIFQLFAIPAAIAVVCVGIYSLFQFMTSDATSPEQLLELIKSGSGHPKKIYLHSFSHAVLQISRTPNFPKERIRAISRKTGEVITYFLSNKELHEDDLYILIASLGLLKDESSRDMLVRLLDEYDDGRMRGKCLDALGALKDKTLDAVFKKYASSEDEMTRYHAVFNLASLQIEDNSGPLLDAMANDASEVVRLNAALGLAYFYGNSAAMRYLCDMLSYERLAKTLRADDSGDRRVFVENAVMNILEAANSMKDPYCADSLKALAGDDKIPAAIRVKAREILKEILKIAEKQ